MFRRLLFVSFAFVACGVEPVVESPDDAGVVDAGIEPHVDAGAPQEEETDAGVHFEDAGVVLDAGTSEEADAGSFDAGQPSVDAGPPPRMVTVCLTGACENFTATCGANQYFTEICDELAAADAGVLRSNSGTTWATFPTTTTSNVMTPLFTALDVTGDGQVDAADGPIALTILGFSWGGKNAPDLATRVLGDSRINQATLVSRRMVMLDPFQPGTTATTVPAGIDAAWEFRHSVAPSDDCSYGAPLAPYLGKPLACSAGTTCADYDFSIAPASDRFNGMSGPAVGHCTVPYAAHPNVIDIVLRGGPSHPLPPLVGP